MKRTNKAGTKINQETGKVKFRHSTVKEPMQELEIEVSGVVTVPEGFTPSDIEDLFIDWIESKGFTFGGGIIVKPVPKNEGSIL